METPMPTKVIGGQIMTYQELTTKIYSEKTGIARGYNLEFLQSVCCGKSGEKAFDSIIARDLKLFCEIEADLLSRQEPKEGDFVEYEYGKFARISTDYHNGSFQLSNSIGVYVSKGGYSQASGCTWDSSLDYLDQDKLLFTNLKPSSKKKEGECWTFSGDDAGHNRGVHHKLLFKVWILS